MTPEFAVKLDKVRSDLNGKLKVNAEAGLGKGKTFEYLDLPGVLDTLPPVLAEQGLVMRLGLTFDGTYNIASVTIQATDTGEEYTTSIAFNPEASPRDVGSTITYYHRYTALAAVSNRAAKDDDAETVPAPSTEARRRTLPTRR